MATVKPVYSQVTNTFADIEEVVQLAKTEVLFTHSDVLPQTGAETRLVSQRVHEAAPTLGEVHPRPWACPASPLATI